MLRTRATETMPRIPGSAVNTNRNKHSRLYSATSRDTTRQNQNRARNRVRNRTHREERQRSACTRERKAPQATSSAPARPLLPPGSYVAVDAGTGRKRLHRLDGCYRTPGLDYSAYDYKGDLAATSRFVACRLQAVFDARSTSARRGRSSDESSEDDQDRVVG